MESENTAGAEESQIEPVEETPTEPSLRDLLDDFDQGNQGEAGDAGGSQDENAPLSKFNDLAGRLGLELDDLYKLEVSQAADGTPVTVENLKDAYAKQDDLTLRELEFEEQRVKQESDLRQAQTELREILSALPEKAIKPEVLQKIRDKHDAQVQLERQRTLQAIPEWKDSDRRAEEMQGMIEHLSQYGYSPDYLGQVVDHKQIKYIRDNWQREQRIRKALERVKAGKPNPTTSQKATGKAPAKKPLAGVKRGTARNQLEAVFSQLD